VKIFLDKNKGAFGEGLQAQADGKTFQQIVEEIGKNNKLITKGSKIDERRVYLRLIDDWQKGKYAMSRRPDYFGFSAGVYLWYLNTFFLRTLFSSLS